MYTPNYDAVQHYKLYFFCIFQEKNKPKGDVNQSPRAMAKFLKEATRVKQVLSANTEIYSQVSIALWKLLSYKGLSIDWLRLLRKSS